MYYCVLSCTVVYYSVLFCTVVYYRVLCCTKHGKLILRISYNYIHTPTHMYPQLDSWWYFKGEHDGVKNWTAMPSIFPHGIEEVATKTGWPIVAHNRYWSGDTDYAKQVCVWGGGGGAIHIHTSLILPLLLLEWRSV